MNEDPANTNGIPIAFTVREAADYIGVSIQSVCRGIDAGTIPRVQLTPNGKKFVPRRALERLLNGD